MRRGIVVSILLVVLLSAVAVADEVTRNWQSVILESFDNPDSRWIVRGGKFLAVADDQHQYDYPFEYKIVPNVWPDAMGKPDSDTPSVLGVQASFTRQGYNYLEFVPVEKDDDADGNPIPRPITIPGRPMAIDLWAWGSNFDYYLELQVRDFRGVVYTLKLGDLGYGGWKNLVTEIPNYIPRAERTIPQRRQMELLKIVLWTRPEEKVAGFQFYLDQIKVLTDLFENPFDGEGLSDPDFVRQTWGSEQKQ